MASSFVVSAEWGQARIVVPDLVASTSAIDVGLQHGRGRLVRRRGRLDRDIAGWRMIFGSKHQDSPSRLPESTCRLIRKFNGRDHMAAGLPLLLARAPINSA